MRSFDGFRNSYRRETVSKLIILIRTLVVRVARTKYNATCHSTI